MAAILNFVGAFISLAVAATVAKDVVQADAVTPTVIFAGLIGAIAWNIITWALGLPSSSSHALIGGVVGAAFAAAGAGRGDRRGMLGKVLIPAVVAPIVAFIAGACVDRDHLPDRRDAFARAGDPRLQARPGCLGRAAGARPRDQRRPEDDGRHHPGPDLQRDALERRRRSLLGRRRVGERDRAGHLHRRVADHQDDGDEDHQDGHGAGVFRLGRRLGGDSRLDSTLAFRSRRPR